MFERWLIRTGPTSVVARAEEPKSEGRASQTTIAMEMPVDGTSEIEIGDEGAVQEVQADGDVKKSGPDVVAFEMDGQTDFATYELDGRWK